MVEVEVIRAFWADGRPVKAGSVISLESSSAAYVVGLGRAAYVVESAQHDATPVESAKPAALAMRPSRKKGGA